ncbi:OHCU decarboxylase domain-containing protein [Hirsutella rhossiliensis]|uniref:OHCU decarboxylase domain-containing protein n=1 Tax=Hirsutella rhossiliensis TaxID=111463 RepID=A0A9P8MWB7_9HYPO|nr:OHCU decarboxylase domain-containing protein [Hirsutella rhossiliensis]KAH0961421.1 OHCU decarboxylase domain-containing protein [Hirsutella rhossiliensis]
MPQQQPSSLPPIHSLRSCPGPAQTAVLDLLFEPSPALHSTLVPVLQAAGHGSYRELIDACHVQLRSLANSSGASHATSPTLLSVLGSHPRLGEKKVDSAQSVAEQANLGGEGEELAALNREYEDRFPGLRYVVFVNGRARPEIMRDMRARMDRGDYALEVDAALQAMCDIAKDRASKLPVQDKE